MVCHSCVQNIEINISKMTGVHEIKVSLCDKNARIQDDPSLISPSKLCNAILDIGLNAEVQGAVETVTATSCKTGSQQEQGKLRINDLLGREKRAWYTLLALAQFPQNFGNFRKICSVALTSSRNADLCERCLPLTTLCG